MTRKPLKPLFLHDYDIATIPCGSNAEHWHYGAVVISDDGRQEPGSSFRNAYLDALDLFSSISDELAAKNRTATLAHACRLSTYFPLHPSGTALMRHDVARRHQTVRLAERLDQNFVGKRARYGRSKMARVKRNFVPTWELIEMP